MLDCIVDYWAQMKGTVHPDDTTLLERTRGHGFNLDFPPPAYIGDIKNAPIIILDNNGGFDPNLTPQEFPDAEAHHEYREVLAESQPLHPGQRSASPYYQSRNYTRWLIDGTAALVNGVAYRSVNGRSKGVAALTRQLPSALFHQNWLRRAVFPLVERGERFVVVHRWIRWNGATDRFRGHPRAVFSTAPVSKDLTSQETNAAETFLQNLGIVT